MYSIVNVLKRGRKRFIAKDFMCGFTWIFFIDFFVLIESLLGIICYRFQKYIFIVSMSWFCWILTFFNPLHCILFFCTVNVLDSFSLNY